MDINMLAIQSQQFPHIFGWWRSSQGFVARSRRWGWRQLFYLY